MPKEVKRKSLHHSAAPFKADGDDALDDIGVVFKMPPPKLSVNPFTGETLPDDDVRSMTSSHMSSASSASRWGRDGDGQTVSKKNRRQARRDFLIQRLSLSKESDLRVENERNRKEKSGTAATLDVLLESLPTRSELFVEKVKVDSKRCQIKREKLTQNDCRNTTTKRANRIIKNEIKSFQDRIKTGTTLDIFAQLKSMKSTLEENVIKQNLLLDESNNVAEVQALT